MQPRRYADELTEAEIRLLLWKKLKSQSFQRVGDPTGWQEALGDPLDRSSLSEERPVPRSGMALASRALRLIEIVIFMGVLGVVVYGGITLATLNHHTTVRWDMPTLTPTPLIQAIVLPSGHTRLDLPASATSRREVAPLHMQSLVQAYANLPTPTAAPEQGVRIQIPALGIDAPVVHGDGEEQLKKGVAHHAGSADPGKPGNLVLSGHNDIYGEVFRYLDRLRVGDRVTVFSFARSYTYVVEGWSLVNPNQVEVMAPTPSETLTLISCYPYLLDTQRIVVKAKLVKG